MKYREHTITPDKGREGEMTGCYRIDRPGLYGSVRRGVPSVDAAKRIIDGLIGRMEVVTERPQGHSHGRP